MQAAKNYQTSHLRFSTAGSVDDGKSTLIGRMLYDSNNVYTDHIDALKKSSEKQQTSIGSTLALLTDGLRAEREQGITIDVAYRYFTTPKRSFILADAPGHEQYTRNMATAASTADATILVVDASAGILEQTRRHAAIASILGVPRLILAINKMDLVDYSEERYDEVCRQFFDFAEKLKVTHIECVPISALEGDNVVHKSDKMKWYSGPAILEFLENLYIESDRNLIDFRFPVQQTLRPDSTYRAFTGQIASGTIKKGEKIIVLPSMKESTIESIDICGEDYQVIELEKAVSPMSVSLRLTDNLDISRGDMIVRKNNLPSVTQVFEAMLLWMNDSKVSRGETLILRHTTQDIKARIDSIGYRLDISELHRLDADSLSLNDIGRVQISTTEPIFIDGYAKNRTTGCFILIDPLSFTTVGAGMIIERKPLDSLERTLPTQTKQRSTNITREVGTVSRERRELKNNHKAMTVWFTGLSGSGKSTVAKQLEGELFESGQNVFRLDGDNLRFGLNKDLGFSPKDRSENIRRAAEAAKLLNDAGTVVLCSFISPLEADRQLAKEIIGDDSFLEVFVSASVEVCEERDPKGLYKKARTGEILEFTGVSAPYEAPKDPDVVLDTTESTPDEAAESLLNVLRSKLAL